MQDRIRAAAILQSKIPEAQVYADNFDNSIGWAYGAHPERLYVLLDGKIVYQGGIGPFFYDLNELARWLEDFKMQESSSNTVSNNNNVIVCNNNNNDNNNTNYIRIQNSPAM